jgi:hypothetical protein
MAFPARAEQEAGTGRDGLPAPAHVRHAAPARHKTAQESMSMDRSIEAAAKAPRPRIFRHIDCVAGTLCGLPFVITFLIALDVPSELIFIGVIAPVVGAAIALTMAAKSLEKAVREREAGEAARVVAAENTAAAKATPADSVPRQPTDEPTTCTMWQQRIRATEANGEVVVTIGLVSYGPVAPQSTFRVSVPDSRGFELLPAHLQCVPLPAGSRAGMPPSLREEGSAAE